MSSPALTSLDSLDAGDFFENLSFSDVEAAGAGISGKELYRCTFERCKLPELRLERATFESCRFVDCDLTQMIPNGTSLRGVTFERCKLLGVDFSRLNDNPDVTFEGCMLRYAAFSDMGLRGVRFLDCEMQDAQLSECALMNADFPGCDLTGATFSRCDLSGADLSTASGVFLDARQNVVKGAFIALETAVMSAQSQGFKVLGFDKPPPRKKR